MKKTHRSTNTFIKKATSLFLSFSLVVTLAPHLSSAQVAYAEDSQESTSQGQTLTEESVRGRIKSIDEVREQMSGGGHFSLVDRSYSKYNARNLSSNDATLASVLPSKVDLRETNTVTPIKNQTQTGTCWAFAANASAETSIARTSGRAATDLSPFQTAWLGYEKLPTDTSSLTGTEISQAGEGSFTVKEKVSDETTDTGTNRLNNGGNLNISSSEFMQGIGVTTAADIPFPTYALNGSVVKDADKLTMSQRRHSVARLSKFNYIGSPINTTASGNYDSTNETVINSMKQEIYDGNALVISYWAGPNSNYDPYLSTYFNSDNNCQYTVHPSSRKLQSNHEVCVVGYDDTFSKENFNSAYQPPSDGAFIVKNSWGTDWGDGGYFYLSYYDQTLDTAAFFEFDTSSYSGSLIDTTSEVVDQYDYMQSPDIRNYSQQWYSNIYTSSHKQQLHNIGTYYEGPGTTLTYKVYKLKENATSPVDSSSTEPDVQGTYTSDYEGYVSIELEKSITLKKGEKYAILFSQKTSEGTYFSPFGYNYDTFAQYIYFPSYMAKTVINDEESWYYWTDSSGSAGWSSLPSSFSSDAGYWSQDNFCVKGYATVLPSYVKFNSNGGSSVTTQTIKEGGKATKPADPKRDGYVFGGWYSDAALTKAYDFSNTVEDDLTLYAKWTKTSCTVTFNTNGGSKVTSQTVQSGKTASKPTDPTKSGYVFGGWYSDAALTKAYDFSNTVEDDLTLYAKWTKESSSDTDPDTDPDTDTDPIATRTKMHRLNNKWTGEHFYTSSDNEKSNLVKVGWTDEGVGWYAPSTSKTPVYRLYNGYVKGGDHHYTMNKSEVETLKKAGWTYEGIGWYSDDSKTVKVYRQYNPYAITGTHNYTTSKSENDKLVKLGWNEEGIAWYGVL